MKVVFFGTPRFAADTLRTLLAQGIDVVAVVTKPDRAKGRSGTPVPTPVKAVALAHHLPVHQPPKCSSPDFAPVLAAYHADVFAVVAYGEIIKEHLLQMPPLGCINVHGSLLPKYRGAAPIQRCLMAGDAESGICIMYMVKTMDAGDVIREVRVPVGAHMTAGELEAELCRAGADALVDVLRELEKGSAVPRVPQDHTLATLAPKVELDDCRIDWTRDATDIHNLVRGSNPEPGAWCLVSVRGEKKRLKVWRTEVVIEGESENARKLAVPCGTGTLRLLEVQLEGKKVVTGEEFLRGLPMDERTLF